MPKKCLTHPDTFCYVCGESQRRKFTPLIEQCYGLYFGCKMGDRDKSLALCISCVTCVRLLTGRENGSRQMSFAVPMLWREPKAQSSDCYFC